MATTQKLLLETSYSSRWTNWETVFSRRLFYHKVYCVSIIIATKSTYFIMKLLYCFVMCYLILKIRHGEWNSTSIVYTFFKFRHNFKVSLTWFKFNIEHIKQFFIVTKYLFLVNQLSSKGNSKITQLSSAVIFLKL